MNILPAVILMLTTYHIMHNTVFAQSANTGLNLTISPTFLDITANPGDSLKEKFRIRNNTDQPLPLSIIVDKLDPHSRQGEVVPVKAAANDPSVSWISFDNKTPVALPHEWVDVQFAINIPKSAAFGYYYALRIGPGKTNSTQNGATTKLLGQIVLPILLNVASPNAKAELQLLSFSTDYFNELLPVTFQVKLQNTGNVHIKPSGTIFVRLSDGSSDAINLNPESGIVLPGGVRTYNADWNNGFIVIQPVIEDGVVKTDKNGKIVTGLVFNWNKLTSFRIGKYSASLLAVYDNGKRDVPLEATTTFWVFPWKAVGIFLISILVITILIRFWLRWYVVGQIRKHKTSP